MKRIALVFILSLAALLPGCSSSSAPTLTSISVTPGTASVAAGLTKQFTATGMYSNQSTQDLTATATWMSSNSSVSVAAGLATTSTQGSATITATVSGVSGNADLTITAPALESIAVTPANDTVPVATLTQFTATGTYSDKSTQDLTATATWGSTNTTEATIASGGLLTALSINTTPTTISATSGSVTGNTNLTVAAATVQSIVILGQPAVTIANGTTYNFIAVGFYNDGSKHNVTSKAVWASTNTNAATINPGTGHALGVGGGLSTTISATIGSVVGNITLNVSNATIVSIVVAPAGTTIAPLTDETFTAIGTFSDSTTQDLSQDVVWASNNTAAATISNTSGSIGVATGVPPGGPVTISATFGAVTGTAPLTVTSATLSSIAVSPATAGLTPGSTLALAAKGTFSDGSTQSVDRVATWMTSDQTVATVTTQGSVTGVANGPVTITAQLNGVSGSASLTVEGFTAITISPASGSVAAGTATPFSATATLTDGTSQDITNSVEWTSSDATVAIMSDALGSFGSGIGNAPGTSTITLAFGGQVPLASLTVTDATLTSIAIKPANPIINLGDSLTFGAKGTFSDGSTENLNQQVVWSSSDITVAIIDATGGISTTGTGTTTITASLAGVSNTTVLTVQ